MTLVLTTAPIVEGGNAATYVADNPFMAGCHIHVNPPGEETIEVRWEVTRFPLVGLVFLQSSLERANVGWKGAARLDVAIAQGDRVHRAFAAIRDDEITRWGIALINDGGAFTLTLSLSISHPEAFVNGLFLIGSIGMEKPVSESTPALFDLEGAARRTGGRPYKTLTSANQGGLMNRMIPMLSTLFVAERTDRRPQVLWGANEHCAASFQDIFDLSGGSLQAAALGPLGGDYQIHMDYGPERSPLPLSAPEANVLVHTVTPLATSPPVSHGHAELRPVFNRLRLAEPVQRMLAAFDNVDFSRTVALHIRRPYPGGAFSELETSKFRLGMDVFRDLVRDLRQALPWMERVLVCTNSLEAEAEMREAFGEMILSFHKSSVDNTRDPVAVQEAMVDMILMSRCPLLFSQETTSFGHFAHVVGANVMAAVTSNTGADAYEFWIFNNGRHTDTGRCRRADAKRLHAMVDEWMSPKVEEKVSPW